MRSDPQKWKPLRAGGDSRVRGSTSRIDQAGSFRKRSGSRLFSSLARKLKLYGSICRSGATVPWPVGRRGQDMRREIQIVFQNPDASLNPRQLVGAILDHPLR